nr:uncharacterized protein LOC113809892 [Penaeus vannamei]
MFLIKPNEEKSHRNIIMGNFNAKIVTGSDICLGKFGIENGFGEVQTMKLNEIDFILADKNIVTDVPILSKVNVGSDHRMVITYISLMHTHITYECIMEENGEVIVDRNRIVERTREFYQQLYFSHEPQQQIGEQRKHSHSLQLHNGRITKTLDENQPREQAGFRKGYSTLDHLAMAFVDYQKAFDSVDIHKVHESIKNQDKGVRQGDTTSPKLFTACLESVFQNLDWETKGIKIDGEYLSHLRFADAIVLVANNLQDLQQMLNELNNESKKG